MGKEGAPKFENKRDPFEVAEERLQAEQRERLLEEYRKTFEAYVTGWEDLWVAVDLDPEFFPETVRLREEMRAAGVPDQMIKLSPAFDAIAKQEFLVLFEKVYHNFDGVPEDDKKKITNAVGFDVAFNRTKNRK